MVKTNKQHHHHHRHIVIIFRSRSGSKWGTWTQTQRPWTVASALSERLFVRVAFASSH